MLPGNAAYSPSLLSLPKAFSQSNAVCATGKASAIQGRDRRRCIRKPKVGEEMDELLRIPNGRHRFSCWSVTKRKMLNRYRICPVFLADLLATGSFCVEGKQRGSCLQGYNIYEGQFFSLLISFLFILPNRNSETEKLRYLGLIFDVRKPLLWNSKPFSYSQCAYLTENM